MNVTLTRTSATMRLLGGVEAIQAGGLVAAATVIQNAVKRGLRGGYTSGDFVTGTNVNHVLRSEPEFRGGIGEIRVGTDLNPCYPLFWEIGHYNIFTRKFERKEVWGPAYHDSRDDAIAAFQRVFARGLAAAHGVGTATITI